MVVCAGVHADRLAALSGAPAEPRIVPFRGDYLVLRPERRHLVRGLVYPVPDPAFPFLGIHTTTRPDGEVWLGPNAVLALAREGYRRRDVSLRDVRGRGPLRRLPAARAPALADGPRRGRARRLTRRFVAAAQRLLPELDADDVLPGPSGIRAQALAPDGTLLDDFVFHEADGVAPRPERAVARRDVGARDRRVVVDRSDAAV